MVILPAQKIDSKRINEILSKKKFGVLNTCSEERVNFASKRVSGCEEIKFCYKSSRNDYQIDLGNAVAAFMPDERLSQSTSSNIEDEKPKVRARVFYSGDHAEKIFSELKTFLGESDKPLVYFLRTGTNVGGGHWSVLYCDAQNKAWKVHSSDNPEVEDHIIIQDGLFERESAEVSGLCKPDNGTEKWGCRGEERSFFLIEANLFSMKAAEIYIKAFRSNVFEKQAEAAATAAMYDELDHLGMTTNDLRADKRKNEVKNLESDRLIIAASDKIKMGDAPDFDKWKDTISHLTQAADSPIRVNVDPVLFPMDSDAISKESFLNDDQFIDRLNQLDQEKSYFFRVGHSKYNYEDAGKVSIYLFFYDKTREEWQYSYDGVVGSILSKSGETDDPTLNTKLGGSIVNGRESYWDDHHCAFLELTSERLLAAQKFVQSFRNEAGEKGLLSAEACGEDKFILSNSELESIRAEVDGKGYDGMIHISDKVPDGEKLKDNLKQLSKENLGNNLTRLVESITDEEKDLTKIELDDLKTYLSDKNDTIHREAVEEAKSIYIEKRTIQIIREKRSDHKKDLKKKLAPVYEQAIADSNDVKAVSQENSNPANPEGGDLNQVGLSDSPASSVITGAKGFSGSDSKSFASNPSSDCENEISSGGSRSGDTDQFPVSEVHDQDLITRTGKSNEDFAKRLQDEEYEKEAREIQIKDMIEILCEMKKDSKEECYYSNESALKMLLPEFKKDSEEFLLLCEEPRELLKTKLEKEIRMNGYTSRFFAKIPKMPGKESTSEESITQFPTKRIADLAG